MGFPRRLLWDVVMGWRRRRSTKLRAGTRAHCSGSDERDSIEMTLDATKPLKLHMSCTRTVRHETCALRLLDCPLTGLICIFVWFVP